MATTTNWQPPVKNIDDSNLIRVGDIFYYYHDKRPNIIKKISGSRTVYFSFKNDAGVLVESEVDLKMLVKDIEKNDAFILKINEGDNFTNKEGININIVKIFKNAFDEEVLDYVITLADGSTRELYNEPIKVFKQGIKNEGFYPVQTNAQTAPEVAELILVGDLIEAKDTGALFVVTHKTGVGDDTYYTIGYQFNGEYLQDAYKSDQIKKLPLADDQETRVFAIEAGQVFENPNGNQIEVTKVEDSNNDLKKVVYFLENRRTNQESIKYLLEFGIKLVEGRYILVKSASTTTNPVAEPIVIENASERINAFLESNKEKLAQLMQEKSPIANIVTDTLKFLNNRFVTGATPATLSKEAQQIKQEANEAEQVKALIPVKEIKVIWNEGKPDLKDKVYTNWNDLNEDLKAVHLNWQNNGSLGYDKVKLQITWKNDFEIETRLDLGKLNDFDPFESEGSFNKLKKEIPDMDEYSFDDNDKMAIPALSPQDEIVEEESVDILAQIKALEEQYESASTQEEKDAIEEQIDLLNISLNFM